MLLTHDRIYTTASGEKTDALLVRDGEIAAIGDDARREATPEERTVEAPGACVMPGLADAHCHLWGVGRRLGTVDLVGLSSPAEAIEKLSAEGGADSDAATEWVLGHGWDEHAWSSGEVSQMDRHRLDDVYPDRPVCLHRVDSHAVVCNTEALERAELLGRGVNQSELLEQVEQAGGRLVTDRQGEPTGLLVDAAMRPVLDAIPEPTEREDETLMERAAERLVQMGVTSVHLARVEVERVEMLQRLEREGALPMRMYALVDGVDPDLQEVLQEGPSHDPDARLSVAGIKLFADGALGSQGALLLDGYPDGSTGLEDVGPEEMAAKSVSWMGNGWQVAVHAIGDRANRRVLDAFGLVPKSVQRHVRPRIEHAQMLADEEVARFAEHGVIPSIQPIHLRSDASWVREMLTEEQCRRLFRWRDLQEAVSGPLASGSDFPIEDPNPWHGLATAVSRRDRQGEVFFADQALRREEAIASYTSGAARAAHWEDQLGALKPGMCADMVAPTTDPFEAQPAAIWETQAQEVWIGGEAQRKQRGGQ